MSEHPPEAIIGGGAHPPRARPAPAARAPPPPPPRPPPLPETRRSRRGMSPGVERRGKPRGAEPQPPRPAHRLVQQEQELARPLAPPPRPPGRNERPPAPA